MNVRLITPADRAAWLAERKNGIGASEAAAALGLSPFESPRELYLRKLGLMEDQGETEAMRWGTLLEPLIAAEYERRTGNRVVEQQVFLKGRAAGAPLFATLDGVTSAGHPVEFKTCGVFSAKGLGEEETDEVPDHWLIQAHQQMWLAQARRVDFAVLVAGQSFKLFVVEWNAGLIGGMLGGLGEFWGRVQRREAPEADQRADGRILHLIYPGCEGEVELGGLGLSRVAQWEEIKAELKIAKEREETYRSWLLERMGNAATGRLPDGRVLTRKLVEVRASTVERKAYTRVDLRVKDFKERS